MNSSLKQAQKTINESQVIIMRIYKPTIRQRDGTHRETEKFYVEFRDHLGIVHRLAGFIEEDDSKELARNVKELVKLRTVGFEPTVKLQGWLETVSWTVIARLTEWQIIDGERAEITKRLLLHIQEYAETLKDRRRSKDYCGRVPNRLGKIVKDCRFNFFRDITQSAVEIYSGKMKKDGYSDTSKGHYLDALKTFLNWAKQDQRIINSSLSELETPARDSEKKGILTPEQFVHLIKTTSEKNILIGRTSGHERAVLYLIAGMTGLRRKELLHLTWDAINLSADSASVKVKASIAKNGKEAEQPVPEILVSVLTALKAHARPKASVTSFSKWINTAELIRADLRVAEIELIDRDGNEICFHSLRNSYISFFANNQTPAKVVQKLARHSDPRLTFNTYTRTFEKAEQKAMNLLPNFGDFVFATSLAKVCRKQDISRDNQRHKNSQEALKTAFLAINEVPPRGVEPLSPG